MQRSRQRFRRFSKRSMIGRHRFRTCAQNSRMPRPFSFSSGSYKRFVVSIVLCGRLNALSLPLSLSLSVCVCVGGWVVRAGLYPALFCIACC